MLDKWYFFLLGLLLGTAALLNVSFGGLVILTIAMFGANLLGYIEARSKNED